jgi:hypothetical protein
MTPDADFLTDRYNELRRKVLDQEIPCTGGEGLALFLRRGMVHWMNAWRDMTPREKKENIAPPSEPPAAHQRELVEILSAMVMKSVAGIC